MREHQGESPTPEIGAAEASALVAQGAVLLDVREPDEWQAGRAPSARHIPLGALAGNLDELPKDNKIVVVCRSGGRSALATDALVKAGYDALNLTGGMQAWAEAALPVVGENDTEGYVA